MNEKIVTIEEEKFISDAIGMLKDHESRMLVVTRNGKQAGIVTDRDIKRATTSDVSTLDVFELREIISKVKIKTIMTKKPVTVPLDYTIEETAEIFLRDDISSVPVVDERDQIVGEITQMEVFKVLISLTGIGKRGIQFAFLVEDRPGSIKELIDIMRSYGGRMMSILTSYQQVTKGYRKVYIRMHTIDRNKLNELINELQNQTTVLYTIDHREGRRVFFGQDAKEKSVVFATRGG
jgi:acetoin utilization protein AcuB